MPVVSTRQMKHPLLTALLGSVLLLSGHAADEPDDDDHATAGPTIAGESLAARTLRDIVERDHELFAKADRVGDQFDKGVFHAEAQAIATSYEVFVQKNPDLAAGYAAYGIFLGHVGMTKQAVAILVKANKLDPNIAVVKNQLAKHIAEDGKPVDALPYLMAAIDLAPKEPLYHYHLGQLLLAGRDDFLESGHFTGEALDKAMLDAFAKASDLAPNDFNYAYQHAKAYNELDPPRWEEALAAWQGLELRPITTTPLRQLVRLQRAHVLVKLHRADEARALLATVTDPRFDADKQTLLDQLAAKAEK